MPHFARRNTQQLLKTPVKSSLFSPNSCTTKIKVVLLYRQSSPSLLTMLKSCEAFFVFIGIWQQKIPFPKTVICYLLFVTQKFVFRNCQLSTVTLVTQKKIRFWKLLYCYTVTLGIDDIDCR